MSNQNHIKALKEKHLLLEAEIILEETRPQPDKEKIHVLKIKKLHLKEEIEANLKKMSIEETNRH